MSDDLIARIYDEYYRLDPYDRAHSHWVMDQATVDWLESQIVPPPDDPDDDKPRTTQPYLLGKPIRIHDRITGFRLVPD